MTPIDNVETMTPSDVVKPMTLTDIQKTFTSTDTVKPIDSHHAHWSGCQPPSAIHIVPEWKSATSTCIPS